MEILDDFLNGAPTCLPIEVLAYLAGILDGEGYIAVNTYKYEGRFGFHPHLTVCSTTREMVDWLRKETTVGKVGIVRDATSTRAPAYRWQVSSREELLWLIPQTVPYLVVKKLHAQLVWKFCKEAVHGIKGCKYTEEELEVQGAYYTLLKNLNCVGPTSPDTKQAVTSLCRADLSLPEAAA